MRLLAILLASLLGVASSASNSCRCVYGEPCWPSLSQFGTLEAQLSQPLIYPKPPATPCYLNGANSSACAAVVVGWTDGNWRSNQSGAMQNTNYETFAFANGIIEACYLNTALNVSCDQGSVSVIGVDARVPSDVQAAVKFAAKYNLRLIVKNTGHDYLGRSDGRGSFSIWTHNMKNIAVHSSFTPTNAPSNESYEYAITLEAGVQWREAYNAATAANRVLVGVASAGGSVGAAGGWLLGGGHSALTPTYGLGVDNVLEITVVLASGKLITASAYSHSDLFWALRGGGGGTFGVVTSLTYQTYPVVPLTAAFFVASQNGISANDAMRSAFTELVRITPALTDFGWGGYSAVSPNITSNTTSFSLFYIAPNASLAEANASALGEYLDYVQAVAANSTEAQSDGALTIAIADLVLFDSWAEWYAALFVNATGQVGANVEIGSRLLPRDLITANYTHVADTLLGISGGATYYLVAGGAASKISPDAAGLNPAWRDAVVHSVVGVTWPEGTTESDIDAMRTRLKNETAQLRALAPKSGCYFNEASLYEPDPEFAFFGTHYPALAVIKAKYDPKDLFIVAEGVGSNKWDKSLTCRL